MEHFARGADAVMGVLSPAARRPRELTKQKNQCELSPPVFELEVLDQKTYQRQEFMPIKQGSGNRWQALRRQRWSGTRVLK
uniref:Uncharacterized protein n=1 Tax=Oryza meridionalis TaxID=40149 RepID=A0A0E0EY54_9ORYZ